MSLRLGLVGRGRWGRNIERTLLSFPDVSVTIIARGERPLKGIDGVLVATQSATHAEVALPYVEAGIATFIEKPMTTAFSDARRIQEAAMRSGAPVFIGHLFLYSPAFLAALELLPSLGAIRYLNLEGMNDNPRVDSSVLWDWLPHHLSMAGAIFGRGADSVESWGIFGGSHSEVAVSRFKFGDTPVVSTVSWLSPVRRKQAVIVCERGTLVFDDTAERRLALYGKQGERAYPAYSDELPLMREMAAFLQAVRSGTMDISNVKMGVDIVGAIEAAETSISLGGRPVAVR